MYQGNKILFVDDDTSMQMAIFKLVSSLGHEIDVASDGIEGLSKFKKSNYDLVITDMRMPNLDGKDFVKRLKIIDKDAVIIVLTGYGSVPSAVELIKLGAYDFLEKPINFEELEMSLNRALEKRQMESQLSFFKGMLLTIIISIPLWLILGVILALFWK